jgi:hypothetical protein
MTQEQKTNVKRVALWAIAALITVGPMTMQQGYAEEAPAACTLATLHGRYVFDATGYNIINGIAVPKTVVEFLRFRGRRLFDEHRYGRRGRHQDPRRCFRDR